MRSTRWSEPERPRAPSTPPRSSSRCWLGASCRPSAPPPSTSTASTSRRTRHSSAGSSRSRWTSRPVALTIDILKGLRDRYESHHAVSITDQALVAAANLADRYLADRFLPDKAIDLIDEAGSRLRIRRMTTPPAAKKLDEEITRLRADKEAAIEKGAFEQAKKLAEQEKERLDIKDSQETELRAEGVDLFDVVDEEVIAEVLAAWTGIPVYRLTEEETAKLLRMEDELHKRVIGQEEALKALSRAIRRTRAGLKDPKRPSGSFIFLGPDRRGQDRAGQDAGRVPLRRRGRADPARHERVHGEAHGEPPRRFASGLRRVRRGRTADRSGAAQAVLRRALRRSREGAPRRVQHAVADPRRRSPDRRPGSLGGLQEHGAHHDVEPRHLRPAQVLHGLRQELGGGDPRAHEGQGQRGAQGRTSAPSS